MTQHLERQGAVIIPFPVRSPPQAGPPREANRTQTERLATDVGVCEFGSGWYHEAAMQDDARRRSPR